MLQPSHGFNCAYGERSPIAALLDMIERKAPHLMRAGGLIENSDSEHEFHGGIPDDLREELRSRFRAGGEIKEIAFDLGLHKQTVWRHTRDLRRPRR